MSKTDEFLILIDNDVEFLSTTDGDEVECISIENLEHYLKTMFNE